MQGSDRGFGKVKSFLKSSVSDCGTFRLLFSTGCCLLSSTYCSWFLVGVLSTVPPVTQPISLSVNACLAGPLCPLPPTGFGPGVHNLNSVFDHWSDDSKSSSCITVFILENVCFLSLTMSGIELLAPHTGKQRRLFITGCWVPSCGMLREKM